MWWGNKKVAKLQQQKKKNLKFVYMKKVWGDFKHSTILCNHSEASGKPYLSRGDYSAFYFCGVDYLILRDIKCIKSNSMISIIMALQRELF